MKNKISNVIIFCFFEMKFKFYAFNFMITVKYKLYLKR